MGHFRKEGKKKTWNKAGAYHTDMIWRDVAGGW